MDCPHCHQPLPEDNAARWCAFCGRDLPHCPEPTVDPPGTAHPAVKINWLVFMLALLGPAGITFLGAWFKLPAVAILWPLAGSLISGTVCATLATRRIGGTTTTMAIYGLLFFVLFAFLSFVLCFAGCAAGGFPSKMG